MFISLRYYDRDDVHYYNRDDKIIFMSIYLYHNILEVIGRNGILCSSQSFILLYEDVRDHNIYVR